MKHIVLLRFTDGTTDETIERVFGEIVAYAGTPDGPDRVDVGTNSAASRPSGAGYTHGMIFHFPDTEAFDVWCRHEGHLAWAARHAQGPERVVDALAVLDLDDV